MEKTKKIVSLILVVMLVLTSAPLAFANTPEQQAAVDAARPHVATNVNEIWFDTSETTEIIRVANQSNPVKDGSTVVKANKSGIAETSGIFTNFAYGMEMPEQPTLKLKIYGMTSPGEVTIGDISVVGIGGISISKNVTPVAGNDGDGDFYRYTFTIPIGGSATANSNIIYSIPVTYNGKIYTVKAYSRCMGIVRPNGVGMYRQYRSYMGVFSRSGHVSQLLCGNSIPGYMSNTVNKQRSYIDYAANVTAGAALSGGGNDDFGTGDWFKAGATDAYGYTLASHEGNTYLAGPGTIQHSGHFSTNPTDGNRVCTDVYIDKGYDNLGASSLNMRMVLKPTEYSRYWFSWIQCFQLYADNGTKSELQNYDNPIYASVGNSTIGTWTLENYTTKVAGPGKANSNVGLMSAAGVNDQGTGGYINDTCVSNTGSFVMVNFGGTGAKTNGTIWSFSYQVIARNNDDGVTTLLPSNLDNGRRTSYSTSMSVRFNTYDTTTLRGILKAIDKGTGFSYGGADYPGKGKAPQQFMYSSGWSTFSDAYDAARLIIAKFNTTDAEISTATTNLVSAYNGLGGYTATGSVTVKHVDSVTNADLVDPQQISTDTVTGQPLRNGANILAYALIDTNNQCTLPGYEFVGATSKTGSLSFVNGVAVVRNAQGVEQTENGYIIFRYQPAQITLFVNTGYPSPNDAIVRTPRGGSDLNNTSNPINFTTLQSDVTTAVAGGYPGTPAYAVFGGFYDNAGFVGNRIDGSSYVLPFQEHSIYTKWNAKPVRLRVAASNGTDYDELVAAQSPTVGSDFTMGTVTFTLPTPPTIGGYAFKGYYKTYSGGVYSDKISATSITADYYSNEEYAITEQTSLEYNTVTIYASYVDLNYKVQFDPQGGTLTDGTYGGYTLTGNELSFAGASFPTDLVSPVPTRAGYDFTGWILGDGTPVSGWTVYANGVDATQGYALNPSNSHTQSNSEGFIAYATWTPKQITGTLYHSIPAGEVNSYNSKNVPGENYYAQMQVYADQASVAEDFPSAPRRYGYVFNYWALNDYKFEVGDRYPTENFELTAVWRQARTTAFAQLFSYVNILGTDEFADIQNDPANITNPKAAIGDTIKLRLSIAGNFYSSASSYIFAYNADFFEPVTAVTATANVDNNYIDGIKAELTEITGAAAFNAYDSQMNKPGGYVVDPVTGVAITNPAYVQITVDPVPALMTNGYKTVSFNDLTYMFEITLKVKNDTTAAGIGQSTFWMPSELYRTPSNLQGDTYISYSETPQPLNFVTTDTVNIAEMPVATVNVMPQARPTRTINLALPKDGNNNPLGKFGDGSTANKTYIGAEGTEILVTYTDDNITYYETYPGGGTPTTVVGFPEPTRDGYHIKSWNWIAGAGMADTWDSYSYATADQDGNTYEVDWEPNKHTLSFYVNETDPATWNEVEVDYDQIDVTTSQGYANYPSGARTEFVGWIPFGQTASVDNVVDFTTYHVTGDASFYAYNIGARKNLTFSAYYDVYNEETQMFEKVTMCTMTLDTAAQNNLGIEIRYGKKVVIVESTPTNPEPNYVYITAETLENLLEAQMVNNIHKTCYEMDHSVLPKTIDIGETNPTVEMRYLPAVVTMTFCAGTYTKEVNGETVTVPAEYNGSMPNYTGADGKKYWTISGTYGTTYDVATATAGLVTPFGYHFDTWVPSANLGTYSYQGPNECYEARWTASLVEFHLYAEDGVTELDITDMNEPENVWGYNEEVFMSTEHPAKTGHSGDGWYLAAYDTNQNKYVAVDSTRYTDLYPYSLADSVFEVTLGLGSTGYDEETTYELHFLPAYTKNKYNVRYYTATVAADNTTGTATQVGTTTKKEYQETFTVGDGITVADKTGYTTNKWYTENAWANVTTPVSSYTMGAAAVNFYAYYVPNTYKVNFMMNDGTGDIYEQVNVKYTGTITAPAGQPTRAGYNFVGWGSTAGATTPVTNYGTLNTVGDGAVSFYAIWQIANANYTVNYYYLNADTTTYTLHASETLSDVIGTTVYADTTKYAVTGQFEYDSNASTPSGVVAYGGGLVLEVYYSRTEYTIAFDMNGADSAQIASITQVHGSAVTAPANPTRTGYTFTGWTPGVPTTMPVGNITVIAQWQINKWNATFDPNGGIWSDDQSTGSKVVQNINYGDQVTAPGTVTREGYTFMGWSPALGTMPNNHQTYTAQWQINQYTITFNMNGATSSQIAPIKQNYGTAITAPADPTRTGYTFTGWNPGIPATMPANNMTVVAQWNINSYNMIFEANGGEWGVGETQKTVPTNYNAAPVAPADPTRTGYTFTGWNPSVPANMPANHMTTYAQWQINSYTITYNSNGGSAIPGSPISFNYGATITKPTDPTRTGYTFDKWTYTLNGTAFSVTEGTTQMPAGDLIATAQWNINSYNMIFEANGGEWEVGVTQKTVPTNYNAAPVAPANPTKTGYTFQNWDPAVPTNMPANHMTTYAQWQINSYTITYDSNGGSAIPGSPISFNYGATITAPTQPTKTGYTFDKWTYTLNGSDFPVTEGTTTMPAGDLVATAQWNVNSYTITYDSNGGSAIPESPISFDYGATITKPTDPTRTGYTFTGWTYTLNGVNFSVTEGTTPMPAGNLIATAQWLINPYTITFDSDGGTAVDPITLNYGITVVPPTPPTKTGYTFGGWLPALPATMPAENNTHTAQWTINQYTITLKSGYGENNTIGTITEDYNDLVTAPADPTRTGYTFTGWSPALPTNMPAENKEHTAQWNINQYNITYDAVGGLPEPDEASFDYGATITAPATEPTKSGYTFSGWDYSNSVTGEPYTGSTMPAYDLNATAVWEANVYTITFEYGHGITSEVIENEYDPNEDILFAADDARTGYTVTGWYFDADCTEECDPTDWDAVIANATEVSEGQYELTLYPQYDADPRTITFDAGAGIFTNGTSLYSPVPARRYDELILGTDVEDPTRTGYTFKGWYDANDVKVKATDTVTDNATYTAKWAARYYTVEYIVNGVRVNSETAQFGSVYTVKGYSNASFAVAQWTSDSNETYDPTDPTNNTFTLNKTGVTTLTATAFAPSVCEVTFDYDTVGVNPTVVNVNYGSTLASNQIPADPTKTGYDFDGWDGDVTATITDDTTFTALWEPQAYTVTYNIKRLKGDGVTVISDNEVYETVPAHYGDLFETPDEPIVENYEFVGFQYANGNEIGASDTVTDNITVYAVIKQSVFVVSFHDHTGTLIESNDVVAQSDLVLIDGPAREHYVFDGWYDALENGTKYNGGETVENDLDLYAVYKRVTVKLIPKAGSTTQVERNSVVENIDNLSTDLTAPLPETENYNQYFVYGFNPIGSSLSLENQLDVQGDGHYVATATIAGKYGTGALIEVYDDVTNTKVEEFHIIIFGDLNGDAMITTTDTALLQRETIVPSWSTGDDMIHYLVRAVDLNGDNQLTSTDTSLHRKVVSGQSEINQATGIPS